MSVSKDQNYNEFPSCYADRLGLLYTSEVSAEHKKALGQFFTPSEVAKLMAGFCLATREKVRILDPGCGVGILSCALAEYIQINLPHVTEIEITAFETDLNVIPYSEQCFIYLKEWLSNKNIQLTHFLCINDYVQHNVAILNNKDSTEEFDVVICNPPYFKIPKNDPINVAAKSIIWGQTNIYSVFLVIAAKLLRQGGQLIFITPRSFSSGSYFKLFRNVFFSLVEINLIHIFDSRRNAFQRDNVLLENVIVSCVKRQREDNQQLLFSFEDRRKVIISTSSGIFDVHDRKVKIYDFNELVDLSSEQKILHIPTSANDDRAINLFKTWKNSLKDFNIQISTGKVVAYRCADYIKGANEIYTVPLIWLNNVEKMKFTWPILNYAVNKEKYQFILQNEMSKSVLIKNKDYIFLRRFSSKDDNSRLVATPYFANTLDYPSIGVENHLNYIYRKDGRLLRSELLGLCALFNSKLFDVYFRTFNGNINVSATELRELPLPDLKTIKKLGKMIDRENLDQTYIDSIVEKAFKIDLRQLQAWMN